jgi:hypothetical protein
MNTGSIIISTLGLIALIILPFILHYLHKKNKDKKFMKDFISLAEKENIVISQKEFWRECYAIGIDENLKKLLYVNKQKDKEQSTLIDLMEVESCRIANKSRLVKTPNGNYNVMDRLDLVFTFNKSDLPEKALEFYDCEKFMTIDEELPLIENWLGIINLNIKNNRK